MATIGQSPPPWKLVSPEDWNDWRWQLRHRLHGAEALFSFLEERGIHANTSALSEAISRYRFSAVPYYLSLVNWADPDDPVRRQCIPDSRERVDVLDLSADPFKEVASRQTPGVVHRFSDRVLLLATTDCAVYCRHCTRKNTLDEALCAAGPRFDAAIDYIEGRTEVREVLISGGDPLLLPTPQLDALLGRLLAIPHVEVLRIGTRVPVVLPMRVNVELVAMLRRHRPLWINTQFNHPRELTQTALAACSSLTEAGIPVSNQSVLLKGINDRVSVMRELCAELQRNLIRPYYVFQCDPIRGISHFRTEPSVGGALERELRAGLGGLCLPRFVADVPGAPGKTPLT
ncbi:MAG: KamA family radical SAM protein [Verrucomicrobia bacterium]|jgi:lysine 2,3-aminomutase|nr:KamA family radical SAM protein [Verrucomicrobiota bacterium]